MYDNKKSKILIVGTVRNVEKTIIREINKCIKAFIGFKTLDFFLVESDSNDDTVKTLSLLEKQVLNFKFISLGKISTDIPDQYDRIRHCRNKYIEYIRSIYDSKLPDYIAVLDLDGMNNALSEKSVRSCFLRDDWDAVLSNQTFGYYDILALRHSIWQKNDWREEFALKKRRYIHSVRKDPIRNFVLLFKIDKLKNEIVYSKMKRISKNSPWIQVESGFGGAAIYKPEVFLKHDYTKEFETIETDHVSLHRKLVRGGGRIFINPGFINSHFNTYNINRYFLVRFLRIFLWSSKRIYKSNLYLLLKKFFKR